MKKFTSATGASVMINPADFEDACDLKSAVMHQLSLTPVNLTIAQLFNLTQESDIDVAPLLSSLMAMDASKEVRAAVFKCLTMCTYDGNKITAATFADPEVRKDYYDIVIACMEENLLPFFSGLRSAFKRLMPFLAPEAKENAPAS